MTLTLLNVIGIVLFPLLIAAGSFIKRKTGRKVKDLDGCEGTIKKKQEYKTGDIIRSIYF